MVKNDKARVANDDDRRTVKSDGKRTKSDDRRMNDNDRRTVKRQKGERKSGDRRTNGGDRRTVRRQNDDDKRTETRRRGVIKKFVSPNKGQALEILQSIPEEQQNYYNMIVGTLEIRYGHKYLRQVYQSQIKSRQQRTNESLQEYEADIERLTHLAYPQAPKECLEQIGIQNFIDGPLDTEMQQAI
ncbi:hypothetical protein NQ318_002742 [Aromia moschata]|uniref:Retrotransposon gag domain-containing protein n=1 Tax=Aromia moschata TaxID=1265417 RepID=A0AAV8Y313_9CUCU|nr:hypothetical protein NQ318_002742 [Aromia moschata]